VERLTSIQGLRGIAVAGVLVCHVAIWAGIGGRTGELLGLGSSGVDLFFVISGFCLAWTVMGRGRVEPLRTAHYLRRRWWRIVPPYYGALALALLANWVAFQWSAGARFPLSGAPIGGFFPTRLSSAVSDVGAHVALAHGLVAGDGHSIDGAFWSLSTEWQFYILLPLILVCVRAFGVVQTLTVAAVSSVAFAFVVGSGRTAAEQWFLSENIPARLVEFAAGIFAAAVAAGVVRAMPLVRPRLLLAAAAAAIAATAFATTSRPDFFLIPAGWAVGYGLLVLALATGRGGLAHRVSSSRLATALGAISFSVYLLHGSVFMLLETGAIAAGAGRGLVVLMLIVVAPLASIGVGRAYHGLVEVPCANRGHRSADGAQRFSISTAKAFQRRATARLNSAS
jgi:peptidoglycan/LPS O-acetylase OafA/YrhL